MMDGKYDFYFVVAEGTIEADLKKALQAKVLHQYKPQDKHELRLRPGDVITEVEKLDQGWCKVRVFTVVNHGRHMPG